MRLRINRFVVLSFLLLALNTAGLLGLRHELLQRDAAKADSSRVTVALTTRDVDRAERLTFAFNQPVIESKKPDEPVVVSPLLLQPLPLGYWQWVSPMRLDYVLAQPLPAGRTFRVIPASGFGEESGQVVQAASDLEIRTRRLAVANCRFQSADRESVTIEFVFNQKVEPGDLLRHLVLTDPAAKARNANGEETPDDARLSATALTKVASETLTIHCDHPRGEVIDVQINEGLAGNGGELGLIGKHLARVHLPERSTLLRAHSYPPGFGEQVTVDLQFSSGLDLDQKLPAIKVTPDIGPVTARISGRYDSSHLTVTGAFKAGQRYQIEVPETLLTASHLSLKKSQSTVVDIPDREASVRFANSRGYLSPRGNLLLDLESVNVNGLRLELAKVHRNNLVAHLDHNPTTRTSRPLSQKDIVVAAVHNETQQSAIELRQFIGEQRGIYHLRAAAMDHHWVGDESVVTITDIALTSKSERGGLLVWATSLRTAQPVAGVQVSALSFNNQTLATGFTQPDGTVRLAIDEKHPDGKPWVLLGEKEDDASFLQIDESQWVLDDVDQKGKATPVSYDVMLYTERGIYRPGETIHVSGLIRDPSGQTPAGFPLRVSVLRPDRRVITELTLTPNAEQHGTFQFDLPTRDSAPTGPYRFRVTLPGSDDILGSATALVEAFEPVRIEVKAEPEQKLVGPGQSAVVVVDAKYLFGQPASGLPVTLSGEFRRGTFQSQSVRGFRFDDRSQFNVREVLALQGTLDDAGHARFEIPTPDGLLPGWWGGHFVVTVTETGGRSISQTATLTLDSAGRHIGLKGFQPDADSQSIAPIGKPLTFGWTVRSSTDQDVEPSPLKIELAQVEYDWVIRRSGNGQTWESIERRVTLRSEVVGQDKTSGEITIECPRWGSYMLIATDEKTGSRTTLSWYASDHEHGDGAVSVNRPERVELIPDRPKFEPGSTAKVLLRSPFAGTVWLCLEGDKVRHQQFVTLTGQSTTIDLPIPADLRGGAFLSASVVRPVDPQEKQWMPHRAAGLTRIVVDHSAKRLPVSIEAPSQVKPGESVSIAVKVGLASGSPRPLLGRGAEGEARSLTGSSSTSPLTSRQEPTPPSTGARGEIGSSPARVHLWAVDEGILLTTAFKTPDPHQHFLAARKAEISTSDIFADLLPDHLRAAGVTRIGGDESVSDDELRGSATPTKRRESVVIWRTWASTDADGLVKLDVQLPEHTGRIRWMAVAVQDDQYGSANYATTLTSPLLVETSWPRFAAPGDKLHVPVKFFNATNQPLEVTLALQTSGPLEIAELADAAPRTVEPGKPVTLWLDATANGLGDAEVTVLATATSAEMGALSSQQRIKLPVRAATTRASHSRVVTIRAGEKTQFNLPAGFIPEQSRQSLAISSLPELQLLPAINDLIDYPYGCLEQTSSRMSALLAASQVLALSPEHAERRVAIDDLLDAGISRLWSMQTTSGGLGYWGGRESDLWGTAYATSILADAAQRGRSVDPRFMSELTKYLSASLDGRDGSQLDDNLRAQCVRVLASLKQPPIGWMSKLSENLDTLDACGRADLARAWHLAGRRDRALAALPEDTLQRLAPASYARRITSPLQQQAMLLTALLEIDPAHAWIPTLVTKIEASRTNGVWRSTLENAAAISALAKYASLVRQEPANFKGFVRSGVGDPQAFDHLAAKSFRFNQPIQPLQVESSGAGLIYVTQTTTGLRTRPANAEATHHGLQVRRNWKNSKGIAIDPQQLKVGDLINVTVSLRSTERPFVENIAIVDSLPAGLEVENPRLATSANNGGNANDEEHVADHVEFLDDRVLIFATAHQHEQHFHYALRVTTAGTYDLPAMQAVCMYAPEIVSTSGAGSVEVRP